jgi:hypothetical protein
MNALVGRELLPTGILPVTSVVTTLCYGPRERAVLRREGWVLEPEIPLDDLPAYVSERGNPGNEKGILDVRVELPDELLRRGVHLSDTPGIGSAERENTRTTYAFLPKADAVIWVTSADTPFSETERAFLFDLRQYVRKAFVVVNKMDLVAGGEREEVLQYIRQGIAQILGESPVRLYPLSAARALEAKIHGRSEELRTSGLPEFEAALVAFLAEDKAGVFLTSILDRTMELLGDLESGEPRVPENPGAADPDQVSAKLRAWQESLERLRTELRDGLANRRRNDAMTAPPDVATLPTEPVLQATARRVLGRRVAAKGSCPICADEAAAAFEYFVQWQYEVGRSAQARNALAAVGGFCHVHTWQFQQVASSQAIAEGYSALVEGALAELSRVVDEPSSERVALVRNLLPAADSCPACRLLQEVTRASVSALRARLEAANGRGSGANVGDICLPHLVAMLSDDPPPHVIELLLSAQVRSLDEIAQDMRSYVLKRDALRRGLIHANEENAWLRALIKLVGERAARYH